jgi:hypothetical protein
MRLLISFICLAFFLFIANSAVAAKKDAASCSIYDAVYKPHPEYEKRDLDFELTVHKPLPGEGNSMRMPFYYFDAFDEAGKKVSTLRMAQGCGLGVSKCSIGAAAGQFRSNDDYIEFKTNLNFDPLSLDENFLDIRSKDEAPFALIFLETKRKFYWASEAPGAKLELFDHFVRYYTPEKILPNFGGYDVWLFNKCARDSAQQSND